MELAGVSALQLGWAVAGFGVIAWFVWRRRALGPMTRGVVIGYSALLGGSAAIVAYVLTGGVVLAAPVGLVGAAIAYAWLRRP